MVDESYLILELQYMPLLWDDEADVDEVEDNERNIDDMGDMHVEVAVSENLDSL